jgi:fused signal recognition particle receptor
MPFSWFKKNKTKKNEKEPADTEVLETRDKKIAVAEESSTEAFSPNQEAGPPQKEVPDDNQTSTDGDTKPASMVEAPDRSESIFSRLRIGLSKTRRILTTDLDDLFGDKRKFDDEMLDDLEAILITADIGVQTTMELIKKVSRHTSKISDADALRNILRNEILSYLRVEVPIDLSVVTKPKVIMVVGVNGVGKTTTIGKLAAKYRHEGQNVLLAAADTFRAAAVEQLAVWAERSGADIVKHKDGADPAAVAYDSVEAARAREIDIVLVDTAGRLHTKVNLMEELKKIKRSIAKNLPDAPHEILLVLDATTGQNALSQAQMFNEALDVTGIAMTKLDGTAKGGIVVSIYNDLSIPIQYVGVGEKTNSLQNFDPCAFVDALF